MSKIGAAVVSIAIVSVILGSLVLTGQLGQGSSASGTSPAEQKCTIQGLGSIGLTVVNSSSGKAISGLSIQVKESTPECATVGTVSNFDLGTMITDANGTIMTHGLGKFLFSLTYGGSQYNVSGLAEPMGLTCLIVYLPSGQVTNRSSSLSSQNYC